MMGLAQRMLDAPVIKGTTGITLIETCAIPPDEERTCVRCGRCVDTCPMNLEPHRLWYHTTQENWGKLAELNPKDCVECGCCDYICASKLPLTKLIRLAKGKV